MKSGNPKGYAVVFNGKVVAWNKYLKDARKSARPWKAEVGALPEEGSFKIGDTVVVQDNGMLSHA